MELILIRHGQTIWNTEKRRQGHKNSALTPLGRQQAEDIGHRLKTCLRSKPHFQKALWVTSPLGRAIETAQIISAICPPDDGVRTDHRLKENGFGAFEGLTDDEIEMRFPGALSQRKSQHWSYRAPCGGESYSDVYRRARDFLASWDGYSPLVLITHEVVSKVIRGHLLHLEPAYIVALKHPQDRVFYINEDQCSEIE